MTGGPGAQHHVWFEAFRRGDFHRGSHVGTDAVVAGLGYAETAGTRRYVDRYARDPEPRGYEWVAWVAPAVSPAGTFTSLIPSWNARTPGDSWLEIEARTSTDGVRWSRWYSLGRWAETDEEIHPTSVPGQSDDNARVRTDVLEAVPGVRWSSYQLRVTLLRRAGSESRPTVSLLGAVVADLPGDLATILPTAEVSMEDGAARGTELPVPTYSQMLHRGEYPHWDSGGDSWCSPTSTAMVLARWGLGPAEEEYTWVDPDLTDRFVDHAARCVFDYAYGGAGNWSFNTAYAARYGTEAFVTRLRSLNEAELFVAAGIPLVASVSFREDELDGAGYDTNGHLLALVGFEADGRVIVNDPASHKLASNDEVRVVFDRAQFERAWLGASGGLVYVIHPHDVPLPALPDPGEPNW